MVLVRGIRSVDGEERAGPSDKACCPLAVESVHVAAPVALLAAAVGVEAAAPHGAVHVGVEIVPASGLAARLLVAVHVLAEVAGAVARRVEGGGVGVPLSATPGEERGQAASEACAVVVRVAAREVGRPARAAQGERDGEPREGGALPHKMLLHVGHMCQVSCPLVVGQDKYYVVRLRRLGEKALRLSPRQIEAHEEA
jgi:hypothetical protein